jgi:hypothetical protein
MSDNASHQGLGPSRKFVPDVNQLESRFLLSSIAQTDVQDPTGPAPPWSIPPILPRTGGVFVQTGSVLKIGVGQRTTNTVQVTDDQAGDVQAQWNGGPVHSLTGITTTFILAERARHDQITFTLTSPRTSPTALAVGSQLPTDAAPAHEAGHLLKTTPPLRTGGTAVQSGSVLTVMVNRPKSNVVRITNEGGSAVQVEWNGGSVHSFTGVATIVVDTKNARTEAITLTDSST